MKNIENTNLYKKITSKENIFTAIYSVESYVFDKYLLDINDIILLNDLKDKYNEVVIENVIKKCQEKLHEILCEKDTLFEASVYFKFKKIDLEDENAVKTRPIHTADLISQICIVCMLNILMFEDSEERGRQLSEISNLLPSYFYGNIPSINLDNLFIPWVKKYKEYTQKIIESFHDYRENKRYKYEVTLDLQNFFPSINPNIIYNIIKKSFSHLYLDAELQCIEQVLIKLLYFKLKIDPHDYKEYYGKVVNEEHYDEFIENDIFYTLGIPQGLPQSYFFGNLCMIQVDTMIKKEIEGESFYYVDDSTIFSNTNFLNTAKFKLCIQNINAHLSEYCKENMGVAYAPSEKFNNYLNYQISIHEEGKSTYDDITKKDDEWGGLYFIAKQASVISYDLFSSIDDSDDYTLKEKVEALLLEIENEIIRIKKIASIELSYKNRLKILIRYKKFYSFRLRILELHEISGDEFYYKKSTKTNEFANEEEIANDYKSRYYNLLISDNPINMVQCKELVEEDIFWTESLLMIKNLKESRNIQDELIGQIVDFENKLYNGNISACYYCKTIKSLKKELLLTSDRYGSLSKKMQSHFSDYRSINTELIIKELYGYVESYVIDSNQRSSFSKIIVGINKILDISHISNKYYNEFVFRYSNSYQRKFYNSLFSHLFSVPISDEDNIIKINGQSIRYFELRILVCLRNNGFDPHLFREKFFKIMNEIHKDGYQKIDFSLLDVLPIFKRFVATPEDIDRLILLHKYVNSLWKNGSKFLYFYTLHNEEHSVELIKISTKLTRAINFLSLKKTDYFILFSSCYLHDISMVIYPDIYQFIPDKQKSEQIYANFKDSLKKINNYQDVKFKDEIKKFIVTNYQDVNDFFENKIRDSHAKSSANFITNKNKEIDKILINPEKQYIADVSEAHGFSTCDIYGLRSRAKTDTINLKYLMILLRLADLMDMVKDRVSINILKQNIKYIPQESKFHWISHLVTDKCEIKSRYYHNNRIGDIYCVKHSVVEEFVVELTLNMKRLQNIKITDQCKQMTCILDRKEQTLSVNINEDDSIGLDKGCKNCYFLCRWMMVKNYYLFNELYDLQRYLNRNSNNLFSSKMKVVLKYDDLNSIPAEYIDIVRNRIS